MSTEFGALKLLEHSLECGADDSESNTSVHALTVGRLPPYPRSPIARLPDEVIAIIFEVLATAYRNTFRMLEHVRPHCLRLGWVLVTHVCRRWREVALLNRKLWCTVDHSLGFEFLEVQLLRSQSAPISWSLSASADPREISLFTQHTFHLKQLDVHNFDGPLDELMAMGLAQPAPLLEHLHILEAHRVELRALPRDLFAGSTPCLRSLSIKANRLPWLLPNLANLTELEISSSWDCDPSASGRVHLPTQSGEPIPLSVLIYDALPRMRFLRKLHLSYCIPILSQSSTIKTAELSYLEDLLLCGDAVACRQVIDHIEMPQSCRLVLRCDLRRTTTLGDLDFIPLWLRSHTASIQYTVDISLMETNVDFSLFEYPIEDVGGPVGTMRWFKRDWTCYAEIKITRLENDVTPEHDFPFTLASKLTRAIPTAQVHALTFNSFTPMNHQLYRQWHNILALYPNIRHSSFSLVSAMMLIFAWSPVAEDAWLPVLDPEWEAPTDGIRTLPQLVTLSVESVKLDWKFQGLSMHEALLDAITRRREAGLPLQQLLFINCELEEAALLDTFRSVVPVSWEKRNTGDFFV